MGQEHSHEDFEPVEGLPAALPLGERILWQGAPQWQQLAIEAFHVRKVVLYFLLLAIWQIATAVNDGEALAVALSGAGWMLTLMLSASAILLGLAYVSARTTKYTITNARIVMRFGIGLPLVVNVPFRIVEEANWSDTGKGMGNIALRIDTRGGMRLWWAHLWPHARPWAIRNPEPMLRAVPQGQSVAHLLGLALNEAQALAEAPRAPYAEAPRAPYAEAPIASHAQAPREPLPQPSASAAPLSENAQQGPRQRRVVRVVRTWADDALCRSGSD
jgi:hypothetical protein